jgi:hypothetical protein
VADAEAILRAARRPLMIGMGGGGDVVGALASAEFHRLYDGGDPVVGGLAWERRPIDPVPGPRRVDEIVDGEEIAPGVLLAGPDTRVRARDVYFGESRMSQYLGAPTLLVCIDAGPVTIAAGLAAARERLAADLILFVDVGGDVLAHGDEPGLRSPLCDAVMLAAAAHLAEAGAPVLLGIFGVGCDAELTNQEVLDRVALVAAAGGLAGVRGLTEPIAARLEGAMEHVPTEASAQAVRAFRGASGAVAIRGGEHSLELSPVAALTIFLDVPMAFAAAGDLARAVADAGTLDEANAALTAIGVRTELDLEADAFSRNAGPDTFSRNAGR